MSDLTASDFSTYFKAVHDYDPFHWQSELAVRVLDGAGWPSGIDVPTGMGKTAILDIAVFALAAQADCPVERRTAPTRTFMVVDRRLIVDQAFDRAQRIRDALRAASGGVLRSVADNLRQLSGSEDPLDVVRMRGGVTWSWRWLASPDQPAIVVGTVDQYGSRLLFRGYGVGTYMRPIDAALVGTDALLVLDEAHMSRPLAHTALTVHRYDGAAERPILRARRPAPVLLSATLPPDIPNTFEFDSEAETSTVARARLDAAKRTALVDLSTRAKNPSADLARAMAAVALDRAKEPGIDRVAVVCNTVRVARAVFENLRREGSDGIEAALMIGRCREFERSQISERWGTELQATAIARPARPRPLVVVATQTIEVGADFDFDAMVSEAAPLDALLQRLGRLDRFGRLGTSSATVLHVASRHGDDDPVYGAATGRTWEWLVAVAGAPSPASPAAAAEAARTGPVVDLGPMAVRAILGAELRAHLVATPPPAPEIIGPTLAAWARTDPAPTPDQPVEPFLHGLGQGIPEVLVCWRAGLRAPHDLRFSREVWEAELESTPVTSPECVSVPIWEARRFLEGASPGDMADVEGAAEDDDPFDERETVPALIRMTDGSFHWSPRSLRPGCTVVVRSESGGHDEWGWTGSAGGDIVLDVADVCRRRTALRLRPALLAHLLGGTTPEWSTRVGRDRRDDDETADDQVTDVLGVISRHVAGPDASPISKDIGERATELLGRMRRHVRVADSWYLVQAVGGVMPEESGDDSEGSSSGGHRPIGLDEHLRDVARRGSEVATRLGLPTDLIGAIELAGLAHDLGKADPRFQVMLHRGNALRAEAAPEPLAKSGMSPADRRAFRNASERAGVPSGMRHEAGSAALLARAAELDPTSVAGRDLDLVLHLVASHHGRGRPLLPPVVDYHPCDVSASLPGSTVVANVRSDAGFVDWYGPARFERLGRRYGWWGLALLETVVRLADIECSEGYGKEPSS